MANCPNCGAGLQAGATKCVKCGSAIDVQQAAPGAAAQPAMVPPKKVSVFLAALLGFLITGLGHIYIGQKTKGIVLLVVWLAFWVIDFVTCGIGFVLHLLIWLVMLIDVIVVAGRLSKGQAVGEWKFF